ncbi:hypothetical protein C9J27_03995 [Photobacterium kishitanii]|uniref:Uncharacterized protein n=1 Tax=Photobacterium kishitanii TaxID=318456 RepID=A0A2T3KN79_9GAMM|nr:hypothetical protein C9J27_03995 [Photobacterium kishitanii]
MFINKDFASNRRISKYPPTDFIRLSSSVRKFSAILSVFSLIATLTSAYIVHSEITKNHKAYFVTSVGDDFKINYSDQIKLKIKKQLQNEHR